MVAPIVQTSTFVTLLGAGDARIAQIQRSLALAPILIAADGGADSALAAGKEPDAVIGDFDSVSDAARARIPEDRFHRISDQETTDFDKALRSIAAPLILAIGFTGGRIDHTLACLDVMLRYSDTRCILSGEADVLCLLPPELRLQLPAGTRLSLFPLRSVKVDSVGLKWSTDGLSFAPGERSGTSNEATGGEVVLQAFGPGMLLILPGDVLEHLAEALVAAERTWSSE